MEPEADPDFSDSLVTKSESEASQELYVSESLSESYDEDDVSDAEYPQPMPIQNADLESPQYTQSQEWETACEQASLPERSGSEVVDAYQERDDISLGESREPIAGSPHYKISVRSLSSNSECLDPEPLTDQISQTPSRSSSSSLGCAGMTLALTLTTEQPAGASNRQRRASGFGSGANRRIESSEEGGCSEAPPASVSFGISDESAEQAEKRNWESDTDLCRVDRNRTRCTRKYLSSLLVFFISHGDTLSKLCSMQGKPFFHLNCLIYSWVRYRFVVAPNAVLVNRNFR